MAADNLPLRDEKAGHGKLPETFAKVRILPKMYVKPNNKIRPTKKKTIRKKNSHTQTQTHSYSTS